MSFGTNISHVALFASNPGLKEINGLKSLDALERLKEKWDEELFFENLIPFFHEFAHFYDIFSTPLGVTFSLVEHVLIFSQARVCHLVKSRWPKDQEIRFPLSDYIFANCSGDIVLTAACEDHIRLRTAIERIRDLYYTKSLDTYYGESMDAFLYDSIDTIPILNRQFFYPKDKKIPHLAGDIGQVAVIDILEAMALHSEFYILSIITSANKKKSSNNKGFVDRLMNMFPRRQTAVELYNYVTKYYGTTNLNLPRYIMWKSLQGPLSYPRYFDHFEATEFSTQHPVTRLSRIMSALDRNQSLLPPESAGAGQEWLGFDEKLSKEAGLDSLTQMRSRFPPSSVSKEFKLYSQVEELILRHSSPYLAKGIEYFTNTHYGFPEGLDNAISGVTFLVDRAQNKEHLESLNTWRRPMLALIGDNYIFDERYQNQKTLNQVFYDILNSFAYSDSDSLTPSLLWRQLIRSDFGKTFGVDEAGMWQTLLGRNYDEFGSKGRSDHADIGLGVSVSMPYRTGRPR